MSPDELKTMPKGQFIVTKTGCHPLKVRLRLFLEWGITFDHPFTVNEKAARPVAYASRDELTRAIEAYYNLPDPVGVNSAKANVGGMAHEMSQSDSKHEVKSDQIKT